MREPSVRAQITTRRTYNRPIDEANNVFETWEQTIDRVIKHQRWLWERAQNAPLTKEQEEELEKLRSIFIKREAAPSGRTLWLGGTDVARSREASMFNCSFARIETVHDVVDCYWLLLQGCGVGLEPVVGTLNGFSRPVELEIIRSAKTDFNDKGNPENVEWITRPKDAHKLACGNIWHIRVGDSAEAWSKLPGKLLANKVPCEKLILDFSEIRPAGGRLSNYGWISSGDQLIAEAMGEIVKLLNIRNNRLLTRMDILDLMNLLGKTLSSRRSAEIALVPYGDPEWPEFARAKADLAKTPWRTQSNNSLVFYHKPSKTELLDIFKVMEEGGGSEPGFINAQAAMKRAPWFKGVNPCAEILLANKSFCNLTEIDLSKFNGRYEELLEVIWLVARANYRQTCVNLDDGVLQRTWHELNEFLRLMGVGLTGIVCWEFLGDAKKFQQLKKRAGKGMISMARELRLPYSKAVTTIKPSGTLSKVMDTTEGVHKPLGRFIFNNMNFSVHDPIVAECEKAGYRTMPNPYDPSGVIVTFPVEFNQVQFDKVVKNGKTLEVNLESAVDQLERYRFLMDNYVEHNCSITVSYDKDEVEAIVEWLDANWDSYVGVSFIYRNDPTKTAQDLGYAYLPQEVVDEETFRAYADTLKPISILNSFEEIREEGCSTGACPIR